MKRSSLLFTALLLSATLAAPHVVAAADPTVATGGVAGTYPPATNFAGVAVNGLQSGFGVEITVDGFGRGQFCAILLGVSSLGLEQSIKLEGEVATGSRPASNIAVFSGTTTVDMGDGLPPAQGIPFTATVTTNANSQGTIGLVTGLASLPNATVNVGSITVQ